jgi:hypothetical protein
MIALLRKLLGDPHHVRLPRAPAPVPVLDSAWVAKALREARS